MINSINWFEIPVTDFERAKAFYSEILNTSIGEMPFPEGRYGILAYDQQGVGGGLVQGEGFVPSQTGTIVYLNGSWCRIYPVVVTQKKYCCRKQKLDMVFCTGYGNPICYFGSDTENKYQL